MTEYPAPVDYLPHAPPMVMLDRVRLIEAGRAICSVRVSPDSALAPFLDPAGRLPAWFGLEIMAQTVGVSAGHQAQTGESGRTQGMLLGTQRFTTSVPAFAAGSRLHCEVVLEQENGPLRSYACSIGNDDGQALASARVNIYQSDSLPAAGSGTADGGAT